MDSLCKLGFIASELLLKAEGKEHFKESTNRAVVLMNRSSSVAADLKYLSTIQPDNYFPSPSHFVYTLPNIVTGEIAIRNHYQGETAFYILPEKNEVLMSQILTATSCDPRTDSILAGWVDYRNSKEFEAECEIIVRS
jgi:3-oxoacyl-[acyl-carrier-protein] synthase-1